MARGFSYAPGSSPELIEASRPDLHRAHIQSLSQSKNWMVRQALASRSDCPLGVLVMLAHDPHIQVRATLASNPAISLAIMDHLAHDKHVEVLIAVIANPAIDVDIVERLAFHKRSDVRAAAGARLDEGCGAQGAARAHDDAHTPELQERAHMPSPPATASVIRLHPRPHEGTHPGSTGDVVGDDVVPTRTAPVRGFRVEA